MLTIPTWGGWGDVLREISLLPTAALARIGYRCRVRHTPPESAALHPLSAAPSSDQVKFLISHAPTLQWAGEGPGPSFEKMSCRIARAGCELVSPRLYDPGFLWRSPLPPDATPPIVLQTHLEGLPSKKWPVRHWQSVIAGLRDRFPDREIHVLDPAGDPLAQAGVTIHNRIPIASAMALVEQSALLISVDSWSKYIAGWKGIPQVVLVPDQTSDYPQLTAPAVWKYSFRGLHASREMKCVGLTKASDGARYSIGPMEAFLPDQVLDAVSSIQIRP